MSDTAAPIDELSSPLPGRTEDAATNPATAEAGPIDLDLDGDEAYLSDPNPGFQAGSCAFRDTSLPPGGEATALLEGMTPRWPQ